MNLASANAAPLSSPDQDAHATLMPFLDALAQPPSGAARAFHQHEIGLGAQHRKACLHGLHQARLS